MRRLAVWASVLVFAAGAVALSPEAEARRRGGFGGIGGGIVAAALIGGIIAASVASSRRSYAYYPRSRAYYGPSYAYASPYYGYSSYSYRRSYAPAFAYRSYRPIGFSRAGFVSRRNWGGGGRRWR